MLPTFNSSSVIAGRGAFNWSYNCAKRGTTNEIRIVRTVAVKNEGIEDLYNALQANIERSNISENKYKLIAEKAYRLISKERMKGLNIAQLQKEIQLEGISEGSFNLYRFLKKYKDHKRSI